MSERFACRVLGQHRSTQRKVLRERADEAALTADIIALASRYGFEQAAVVEPVDPFEGRELHGLKAAPGEL